MSSIVSDPSDKDVVRKSQAREDYINQKIENKIQDIDSAKIPEMPKMPDAPKESDYATNPMKTFGSGAMWIAAFGSLLTRHPLATALNSAAEVNKAAAAGDANSYKNAMDKWKIQSEYALKLANYDMDKYKASVSEGDSSIKAYSSMMKNDTARLALDMKQNEAHLKDSERQLKMMEEGIKYQNLHAQEQYANLSVQDARDQAVKEGRPFSEEDALKVYSESLGAVKGDQSGKNFKDYISDRLAKFDWNSAKPADIVPGTGLSVEAIKGYGTAILGGSKASQLGLGYSMNPVKKAVENYVYSKDPSFDMAKAQLAYGEKTKELGAIGTRAAAVRIASHEMDELAPPMVESIKALDPSQYPNLNSIENAVATGTGDDKVITANKAVQDFKTAMTQVLTRNGVATDAARAKIDSIVDLSFNTRQVEAVVKQGKIETKAVLEAIKDAKNDVINGDNSQSASKTAKGGDMSAPLAPPKDNRYEVGKYYDLTEQGHGIHKYLGNGEFE